MIEILVPELPESVADATVAQWHKQAGDFVERDEVLVLASDGVWDNCSSAEAVDSIMAGEWRKNSEGANLSEELMCTTGQESAEELRSCGFKGCASRRVVGLSMRRAATRCGLTVDALAKMPGSERRHQYDDCTAIVLDLRPIVDGLFPTGKGVEEAVVKEDDEESIVIVSDGSMEELQL